MVGVIHVGRTAWLVTVLILTFVACGDPCRDLSEKVCKCELDPVARRRCLDKVALRAGVYAAPKDSRKDAAERHNCAQLVDICSCEKLAAGDTASCGLSLPAPSTQAP